MRLPQVVPITLPFVAGAGALLLRAEALRADAQGGSLATGLPLFAAAAALGFAAGARLIVGPAERARRPLLGYGTAVAVIGAAGIASPALAAALAGGSGPSWLLSLLGPALVAAPVGAVVPYALEERRRAGEGSTAAGGFVVGALLGGGALVLGVIGVIVGAAATRDASALAARLLCMAVALIALAAGARASPAPVGSGASRAGGPRAPLLAACLAGLALGGLALGWFRVAACLFEADGPTRAALLAALLLSGAAGWWASAGTSVVEPLRRFGRWQLVAVGWVALMLPAAPALPWVVLGAARTVRHVPGAWLAWEAFAFLTSLAVAGAPAFMLAASLPPLVAARERSGRFAGALGDVLLAVATGIAGAATASVALSTSWETELLIVCALAASLGGAALARWSSVDPAQPAARRAAPMVAVAVAFAVLTLASGGWFGVVAVAGRASEWSAAVGSFDEFQREVGQRGRPAFVASDDAATAAVIERGAGRTLRVNGRVEGGTGESSEVERFAAHLGVLLGTTEVRRALVLGPGTGAVLEGLAAYPLDHLDVVAASRPELEAVRAFVAPGPSPLDDPRVSARVDGALAALSAPGAPVDLLIVWATPHQAAAVFTREWLAAARRRLAPGGRLVLRLPIGEWSEPMVRLAVRTARQEFSFGTTWCGPDDELLLLTAEAFSFDLGALIQRMSAPRVAASLARLGVHDPVTFLAHQTQSDPGQRALGGEGPANGAAADLIGFGAALAAFAPTNWAFPDERRSLASPSGLAIWAITSRDPLDARQAREVHGSLVRTLGVRDALVRSAAELWLTLEPGSRAATIAVARSALAQGNSSSAKAVLEPLIIAGDRDPELVAEWLDAVRGVLRREVGPWFPGDPVDDAVALGRSVLMGAGAPPALAEALRKLEEAR